MMDHERLRRLHGGGGRPPERISHDIALKSATEVAARTWLFVFEKPAGFAYRAGQHGRMSLIDPTERDDRGESRFLSFASAPHEEDLGFAVRMRDSAFKRSLARLRPGDRVHIEMLRDPPHGAFLFDIHSTRPAVFLAGGIGIVPAFSVIKDALANGCQRQLTLFYTNRDAQDATFLDRLQELAKHHSNFTLTGILTGGSEGDPSWQGETGRISTAMLRRYLANLRTAEYYIAGLPGMVDAMQNLLRKERVPKAVIHAEEFAGFAEAHGQKKRNFLSSPVLPIGLVLMILVLAGLHLIPIALLLRNFDWHSLLTARTAGLAAAGLLGILAVKWLVMRMLFQNKPHRRH